MNAPHPNAGQTEEAAVRLEGVGSQSLRDTQTAAAPEMHGGLLFAYPSGSRPLEGYTIRRGVGRGGFGEVYYATSDAGKDVALKLVRRNFEVELRGVTQCLNLKHANLISLYDVRQDGHGANWVVMEYVAGESLEQILDRHPQGLPLDEAVRCMRQICAGVAYLHDRGIVHRDLKPGNIFLDEGTYKIGDYGLSKFISHSRRSGQTESIGTVHYMAPEIANGRYGKEIDTYALGVMFYEMLSGQVPYEGESIGEVLMKHLTAEPDLTRVPEQFRPIVARLLRKDPEQRYPNVPAVMADIEAAVAGQPLSSSSGSTRTAGQPQQPETGGATGHGREQAVSAALHNVPASKPKRLRASSQDQIFSGVCAGMANYLGIDPVWVRLAWVVVTFMTSGIPVLIYFVLAAIMPTDDEESEADATAGFTMDGPVMRALAMDAAKLLVSLLLAIGVGCLATGIAVSIYGWSNDAIFLVGPASGFLVASIAIVTTMRSGHAVFRSIAVLLFAASIGCAVTAGAAFVWLDEAIAVFLGVGTGLMIAAGGLVVVSFRHSNIFWRLAASLALGVGAGLLVAAFVGMCVGGYTAANDELIGMLGFGTGFLVTGLAGFALFFGPLSPVAVRRRDALRATQAWGAEQRPPRRISGWLIVAAVVLGLFPAAMVAIASIRVRTDIEVGRPDRHACSEPGCQRVATHVLDKQLFAGSPQRHEEYYCSVHARLNASRAQEAGLKLTLSTLDGSRRPIETQTNSTVDGAAQQ